MVQQAIADDRIKCPTFQSHIGKIVILEPNARIQSSLSNMSPAESQHCFGTVDSECRNLWESFGESDGNIRRPTAKIDNVASRELRKSVAKVSRDLSVRFTPICSRVGCSLCLLIHQFGFGHPLHFAMLLVPHRPRSLQAWFSK